MTRKHLSQLVLSMALASGLLLAAGVPQASADRDDKGACDSRLRGARERLDSDIAHHGDHSKQAERDRARLEQARRWCRDHHADWDHDKYDR